MKEQLIKIIAEELSVEEKDITLESDLQEDLGADSLDAIQLIMSIENEFDVTVPESEIDHLKKVSDILKYLEENK
ncbi:MAG: acyl carrier protein [Candidatus Marinimicrobia bacterium]|nr:acyl carrier protein [Candidatus Neomarinimicrobiota bacterium]